VIAGLPDSSNGAAAGSWAFLRGTGSLFGVAVPSAIFNAVITGCLPNIDSESVRSQLANGQAYQRATSAFVHKFDAGIQSQIVDAFTKSLVGVWAVFTVFAGVGFALTFLERQLKLRQELDTRYGLKTPRTSVAPTPVPASGVQTPVGPPTVIDLTKVDSRLEEIC
jgi:hypothetical protein